jgi:hypothetical protein
MQLVSVPSHKEDYTHRLHVLSIVFFVIVAHFLQHLIDASLVQSSLSTRLAGFMGRYRLCSVTDRKTLLILLKYWLALIGCSSAS